MKLPYEVEVKLRIRAPSALRRRLKELGFTVAERRHFEANMIFDFRDLRLRKAGLLLRLRKEGRRHMVTFKGAPRASASYKIRREIETDVEDGAALRSIFEALGLRPVFRYEKYRTAYAETARSNKNGSPMILLDETPIGNYVELEGPKRWIDRLARQLGYHQEDYITASYATLHQEYCRQRRIPAGDMVFNSPLGS